MGYSFTTGATKKDRVNYLTQSWSNTDKETGKEVTHTVLKSHVKRNVLYMVVEATCEGKVVKRSIAISLLMNGGAGCGWGSKDMCEAMGVYVYDCPVEYFDMVPCPNKHAAEWREKVQANN